MIKIYDDFLDDDLYDRLGDTSMTFSQVQWVGRYAKPENAFHEFKKNFTFMHIQKYLMVMKSWAQLRGGILDHLIPSHITTECPIVQ